EHEGRGPAPEALGEVRTARLLAHGHQPLLAEKQAQGTGRGSEGTALPRPPGGAQEGRGSGRGHGFTINGLNFSSSRSRAEMRSASGRSAKLPTRTLNRPSPSGETT